MGRTGRGRHHRYLFQVLLLLLLPALLLPAPCSHHRMGFRYWFQLDETQRDLHINNLTTLAAEPAEDVMHSSPVDSETEVFYK